MANNKILSLLYIIVLLTILPTIAISSSQNHKKHNSTKSKQFTLYQHNIFNKTNFIIVEGLKVGANLSQFVNPFGTIAVANDNLTLTKNPSSKVIGNCEAFSVASSFDGLEGITIARFVLDLKDGPKGTISMVGVFNNLKPSEIPISGGTGDFLLVQGYITSTIVYFKGLYYIYKVDFHLFWPPYAPYAIKA